MEFDDLRAITRELDSGGKVQYRPFVTWLRSLESARDTRRPDPRPDDARAPAQPEENRLVARPSDRDDSRGVAARPSDRDDSRLMSAWSLDRSNGRPVDTVRPSGQGEGSRTSVTQDLLDRLAKGAAGPFTLALCTVFSPREPGTVMGPLLKLLCSLRHCVYGYMLQPPAQGLRLWMCFGATTGIGPASFPFQCFSMR